MSEAVPLQVLGWMFLLSECPGTPFTFTGGVRLVVPPEPSALQAALARALESQPIFRQVLVPSGIGGRVWVRSERTPRLAPPSTLGARLSPERALPWRLILSGRDLLLEVHHVLTDGFGAIRFLNAVLAELYGERPPKRRDEPLDPLRQLLAEADETAGARPSAPRLRPAPYRARRRARSPRRKVITTWSRERLESACLSEGVPLRDFLGALYLQATHALTWRPAERLAVNVAMPLNLRLLFRARSAYNCSGMAIAELDLDPDASAWETARSLAEARQARTTPEHQLATLLPLLRSLGGAPYQALPFAAKKAISFAVSRLFSERYQTEMISWFGLHPFPRGLARHVERAWGVPAVKHTRYSSFGLGGVHDAVSAGFHLRSRDDLVVEGFRRRLLTLVPESELEAPQVF